MGSTTGKVGSLLAQLFRGGTYVLRLLVDTTVTTSGLVTYSLLYKLVGLGRGARPGLGARPG